MNLDEASQLSLDYQGSQSPSPPPLIVPAGRRYFAGIGTEATAGASGTSAAAVGQAAEDRNEHGSSAAALAELQGARDTGEGERRGGRLPARAAPTDSRSSAQHRTEHRRQDDSRDEGRSGARDPDRGRRGSGRSEERAEPDSRQRTGRSSGSSSGRRQHSPPVRQRTDDVKGASRRERDRHPDGGARHAGEAPASVSRHGDRSPEPTRRRRRSCSPAVPSRHRRSRSPPDRSHRRRSRSPAARRSGSPRLPRLPSRDSSHRRPEAATGTVVEPRRGRSNNGGGPVSHEPLAPPPEQAALEPGELPPPQPPPPAPERAPDPRLDFFSPQFDALLALYTQGLQLPNPKAAPLDFVLKCRNLLPPTDENWLPPVDKSNPSKTQRHKQEQASRAANSAAAAAKAANRESPLDAIAAGVKAGPLTLLRRAYEARGSVRVVTRHARGIRGVATGTLLGFDKHMNLILRDVEETYTVLLRVCRPLPPRRPAPGNTSTPATAALAGDAAAAQATGGAASNADTRAGASTEASTASSKHPVVGLSSTKMAGPSDAASRQAEAPQGGPASDSQRVRWGRKQEVRRRTLKQVFVRGDNIVLVSLVPTAAQPPPD